MEEDLRCRTTFDVKTTFDGRRLLVEEDLWWKKTTDGRRPLKEDELRGRMTFMEDDLGWWTTFDGRPPLMEDNLWWKMTSDGRWPLLEDGLYGWRPVMEGSFKAMVLVHLFEVVLTFDVVFISGGWPLPKTTLVGGQPLTVHLTFVSVCRFRLLQNNGFGLS